MKPMPGAFLLVLGLLSADVTAAASERVQVVSDGDLLRMEANPFVENDRTLVPFRAVAEALDAKVDWREDTRTVTVEKEGRTVCLQAGSARAEIDGEETPLDCPAQLRGDRVFVPLRFISESLCARVDWQDSPPTVLIRTAAGESLPLSEEICPLLSGRLTMRLPAAGRLLRGGGQYPGFGGAGRQKAGAFPAPGTAG